MKLKIKLDKDKYMDAKSKRKMLSLINENVIDDDNIGNKKTEEPLEERFLGLPTNHDEIEEIVVNMINTSPKIRKVMEGIINNVLSKSTIRLSMKDAFKKDE